MNTALEFSEDQLRYLNLLGARYPTVQSVATRIINLQAVLDLPKGTEHFMSDLHGEYEAFSHILNNASGVVREKVDMVFENTLSAHERAQLATLIYYPERKLQEMKKTESDLSDFYRITLNRMIEVCRLVASKYTRSKVRRALPKDFEYIIDELLHTNSDVENKELYYGKIISTIIDIDRADAFIVALATLIKRLAVDRLHIIGDIFDRGPRPDIILDSLMEHHCVDIQWGNHDILWMGAAAGSEACIANVLNVSLQYNNFDAVETGYNINLRQLAVFAGETYSDSSCFAPKLLSKKNYDPKDLELVAKIHKAIVVIQFKLEGQIIRRHPEYKMENRMLLHQIDPEKKTVWIEGKEYPVKDVDFPTIDWSDPYRLSNAEAELMSKLKDSFRQSERLQKHVKFLYAKGGIYRCFNSNLLFHGCIPLQEDGSFAEVELNGKMRKGKKLMDHAEALARQGYFAEENSVLRQNGEDFLWYLWCGNHSPLFGRNKMTTFERYLVDDPATHAEVKNPYYRYTDSVEVCRNILREFGLDEKSSHIINGHVPVKTKDGESPVKARGQWIIIDGGFCKAYQPTTGIAGYTLINNSHGMRLISHQPFTSVVKAIEEDKDIISTSTILETEAFRKKVQDTDEGRAIIKEIEELKLLLSAYRMGVVKETGPAQNE